MGQLQWPTDEEKPRPEREPRADPTGLALFTFPIGWVAQAVENTIGARGLLLVLIVLIAVLAAGALVTPLLRGR